MLHRKLQVDGMGLGMGWYPGGVKYRAPYAGQDSCSEQLLSDCVCVNTAPRCDSTTQIAHLPFFQLITITVRRECALMQDPTLALNSCDCVQTQPSQVRKV